MTIAAAHQPDSFSLYPIGDMASMIKVETEKTMPELTAHSRLTQMNILFLAKHLTPSIKGIRSWSDEGEDGILGLPGKKTVGIVHAVDTIAITINIQGTLSDDGANIGITIGASAIPIDNATGRV